jgi:MFS family permease
MKQTTKFYIGSFLKNQTYFTPIFVLLLQFYNLNFQEIFWVFTIGSVASLLLEIPTGIIADLWGRKKSIIISKFFIMGSYLIFAFSKQFWFFVIAQVIYEIGEAFRSGTEAAYVYDYLEENKKNNPTYTEVKAKQKYYARIGESIATTIGGFLAVKFGYNSVFLFATFPAFLNLINTISWKPISENTEIKLNLKNASLHAIDSIKTIIRNKQLFRITLNITIFYSIIQAVNKFIQPYMVNVGIPIENFGIIYTIALFIAVLVSKYSYIIENKFGTRKSMNTMTFLSAIPMIIIGFGLKSYLGVLLLFSIIIIENFRSPIANTEFHNHVKANNRATMGSILALSKSIGKIAILPIIGYFADVFSIYYATLFLGIILMINGILFFIKNDKTKTGYINKST